ncbi:MAG: tetratricopeptide repeat protein [Tannerella sp.]|jgi:tetratricopeptide (TPR) repeat protein|nr:tetratricopeptide repeat protein [Tannerella sp.]
MAGKHEQAVGVLQHAVKYYPNTVVYTTLGNSYRELNKTGDAEQSYLKAWYMIPCRFYPKYLLARLYDETGQAEKALAVARELLEKEVKIESTAVREIKAEMEKIIRKYQGSPVGFKLQKWKSPQGDGNR